jgi:predicted porin
MFSKDIKNNATSKFEKIGLFAGVSAFALGLIGFAAAPTAAHADVTLYNGSPDVPSVTIYARIDAGVDFNSNVDLSNHGHPGKTGTVTQGGGNNWGTSMFGVKGTLPIDPELSAIYLLESGFSTANGQFNSSTNSIFNRRAYAGLSDTHWGTLTAGKDLFIDNDVWNIDPMVQENMSTSTLVQGRSWQGGSDMVEYRSPNVGGFTLGAQVTFGGVAGNFGASASTANKGTGGNGGDGVTLHYSNGPVDIYGIWSDLRDDDGHYTNIFTSSHEAIIGGTLNLAPVEIFAGATMLIAGGAPGADTTGVIDPGNTLVTPSSRATMEWIGPVWTVSPKVTLRAAFFHANYNNSGGSANLITGGGEYYLRKNVFLYLNVGEVTNSGNANMPVETGSGNNPEPGKSQFGGYTGISVAF